METVWGDWELGRSRDSSWRVLVCHAKVPGSHGRVPGPWEFWPFFEDDSPLQFPWMQGSRGLPGPLFIRWDAPLCWAVTDRFSLTSTTPNRVTLTVELRLHDPSAVLVGIRVSAMLTSKQRSPVHRETHRREKKEEVRVSADF